MCCRLIHEIHKVFTLPDISGHSGEDPVSIKEIMEGEGLWETWKECLGWVFDSLTRCIEISENKLTAIMAELKLMIRQGHRTKSAIEFKWYISLVGKLCLASIGIPGGKFIFQPLNELLRGRQISFDSAKTVYYRHWRIGESSSTRHQIYPHTRELIVD